MMADETFYNIMVILSMIEGMMIGLWVGVMMK